MGGSLVGSNGFSGDLPKERKGGFLDCSRNKIWEAKMQKFPFITKELEGVWNWMFCLKKKGWLPSAVYDHVGRENSDSLLI